MGEWAVAYDIRRTMPWLLAVFTLLAVLMSAAFGRGAVRSLRHREGTQATLALLGFALAFGAGVVGTGLHWYGQYVLRSAVASAEAEVAVGSVEDFQARRVKGRWTESFQVGGTPFHQDQSAVSPGLRPASDSGPCRSGRQVRITHRQSVILRVEVGSE